MTRTEPPAPSKLDNADVEAAYARWAPIYDLVFTWVMRPGRRAAAAAAGRPGGHILDVGVGTGLELPMIDRATRITGVDLSRPMLFRAQQRVRRLGLDNIDGLLAMDAMRLGFPDASFDAIVAPYVLTVVPDPWASLDEWARVLKPGGEIVLVNHVGAAHGADRRDRILARAPHRGARLAPAISLVDHRRLPRPAPGPHPRRAPQPCPPLGLFTLTRIAKA